LLGVEKRAKSTAAVDALLNNDEDEDEDEEEEDDDEDDGLCGQWRVV
jgi:hypothetical protein